MAAGSVIPKAILKRQGSADARLALSTTERLSAPLCFFEKLLEQNMHRMRLQSLGIPAPKEQTVSEELCLCSHCREDANRHGFIRYLDWNAARHFFCSYGCEFFWRNERLAAAAEDRKVAAFAR